LPSTSPSAPLVFPAKPNRRFAEMAKGNARIRFARTRRALLLTKEDE
jgi:hypothetical protein